MRTPLLIAAALAAVASPALAQSRPETVTVAQAKIQSACSKAGSAAVDPATAVILASIGGQLAGSAMNGLGEALEAASREHGFVAEGVTSFPFYDLLRPEPAQGRPAAVLRQEPRCLSLEVADKLYVEAELRPVSDGMIVAPVYVDYREPLPGAPKKGASATELHVSFAVPAAGDGAVDIGKPFATVQIKLPKLEPGRTLQRADLGERGWVVVPRRPTAGAPDTDLTAANAAVTRAATASTEVTTAQRALASAQRKHQAKPTAETAEAVRLATEVLGDKTRDKAEADARVAALTDAALGGTNVKARFVVVRDANKLGLAIAKALKDHSDEVQKAVVDALTPAPAWAASDTAYLQAITDVAAKQREVDAAVAAGDLAKAAALRDALVVLQARANEQAVAARRPLPYPDLL